MAAAAFEEMGVLPELAKATEEMDWTLPTDVQAEAIPLILGGGDVLMAAETGSGKTGAFCLPIIQIVWETLKDLKEGKRATGSGGSGALSKWSLSLYDRGPAFVITPEGNRCQCREAKDWQGCRATKGVYGSGKYYYEVFVADEGLCRVGWSTQQATLELGTDRFGYGYGGTGKKSHNKQFDDYGGAFGKSDLLGCCLDLDALEIRYLKNGVDLGLAFKISPKLLNEVFYPAVVLKNAEMQFNFGEEPFKRDVPNGYVAICRAPAGNTKNNSIASMGSQSTSDFKLVANAPQAIIIEPTKELSEQTNTQIKKFKLFLDSPKVRDLLIIGGIPVREQVQVLNEGVDIVVGTPGRLEELINTGQLSLAQVRFFVLDEADGLLKGGHTQLINRMHQLIPKVTPDGKRLQMIVCSATLHDFEVKKLAERLMHFPTWIDLKGEDTVPETVHHVVVPIDPRVDLLWHNLRSQITTDGVHYRDHVKPGNNNPETLSEAVKILKGEYCVKAIDTLKMDQAIIFCRTKVDCDNLENYLCSRGGGQYCKNNPYSCVCLHGDRKPQERKDNLDKFKKKIVKFLICTDVAARGLDISGLPFMINITLPDEKSDYIHRIGRVGRAERMGLAISLVSKVPEKVWYHMCQSRGKSCQNTDLTAQKGCCVWYNEPEYLAAIEDHLNVTIPLIDTNMEVPCDEFDGKVVYGKMRKAGGSTAIYHLDQTARSLAELTNLESQAQLCYLKRHFAKEIIN